MQHILYGADTTKLKLAILIKSSAFNKSKLLEHYIKPIHSITEEECIGFDVLYQSANKCSAAYAKEYIGTLLPHIKRLGIKTILVADSVYFKYLTNAKKVDPHYGYLVPCAFKDYEDINIVLSANYQAMVYNPDVQKKIDIGTKCLINHFGGNYLDPGTNIIKYCKYPESPSDIMLSLATLNIHEDLVCDIETKGLKFYNCGIATISFAWNKHEGIAFPVDRGSDPVEVKKLLKAFFELYKGKIRFIYHNAGFDMKVLVYELWMKHLADYEGMLQGIQVLTASFEDTKLITYLATNNSVENVLKLKILAQEFAGNYGQDDIEDTTKIDLPDLLQYNLVDCLSTWYVYNKYHPMMLRDKQEPLYKEIFKPSVKTLLQTELCGMPIDPVKVQEAKTKLTDIVDKHSSYLQNSMLIKDFHHGQLIELANIKTSKAKKKVYNINDPVIARVVFNPNSDQQLQKLIYDYMGYAVIDLTKGKQPATGIKTLEKLKANAKTKEHSEIFENLIALSQANKILTSFIPAFEQAQQLPDGSWRLYGNFNLGGTQSLRLSSSDPNLQQIPSNSTFSKIIKECFISPKGWIFFGSDFDSLEDKVNALVTKDPNKIKVYTDGYDGHSLRAYAYFGDKMHDIDPDSVLSINSIADVYPDDRQDSKAPTFALTYMGTYITLMNNCGFPETKAKHVEKQFHILYHVADAWIAAHIENSKTLGYVPLAFGGIIRTPVLAKCKPGKKMSYVAEKEARSAGNAATQSYCILTMRAMNEFMERVWASEYRYQILPSATIHDAIYGLTQDDVHVVKWINDNLIDCMAWQDLPELEHDKVKISSSLELYHPSWVSKHKIPNNSTAAQIWAICRGV